MEEEEKKSADSSVNSEAEDEVKEIESKDNPFRNSLPNVAFAVDEMNSSEAEDSEDLSEEELKADLAWADKLKNAENEVEKQFGLMRKQTKKIKGGNAVDAKIASIINNVMQKHADELKEAMKAAMEKAQEEAELHANLKEQGIDTSFLPGANEPDTEDEEKFDKSKYGFMLHMPEETLGKYVFGFLPIIKIKDGTY